MPIYDLMRRSKGRLGRNPEWLTIPAFFVLAVAGWEIILRMEEVPAYIFPTPFRIVGALWDIFMQGRIWGHFGYTFSESMLGFAIGAVAGIIFGTVIAEFALVERTLLPYLVALQTMPKIALAPVLIIWFGYGMSSKIVISALVAFFPVLVNVIAGLKSIDEQKINLMKSLSASRWQIFSKVRLPNALPYLFAGFDIAIVFAILGAIVGEFVGSQQGLGFMVMQYNLNFDMPGVFATILVLSAMGVSLHLTMTWLQRKVTFWAQPEKVIGA